MRVLRKLTPSELFKTYRSKSVNDFEHWMEPLFFWESKSTLIHDDGSVAIQITPVRGGDTYCYSFQIYEAQIFWRYKNTKVKIFYKSEDMSKVHLFEKGTYKYIGEVQPTLVLEKHNKAEILKIHRKANREITAYRALKNKQDKNVMNGFPEDYETTTPNLDAQILRALLKKTNRVKREKGEVDISKIKIQNN